MPWFKVTTSKNDAMTGVFDAIDESDAILQLCTKHGIKSSDTHEHRFKAVPCEAPEPVKEAPKEEPKAESKGKPVKVPVTSKEEA